MINTQANFETIGNMSDPLNSFTDLSSLVGTQLLSASQAANQPQFIRVFGFLKVDMDYTFASGSEIIMESEFSEIAITQGERLTVINTDIHGCDNIWRSISVLTGGIFELKDSRINDGQNAVRTFYGSNISIRGNVFRQNNKSILLGSQSSPVKEPISLFNGGIADNTFIGDEALPDGTFPEIGIEVQNVEDIVIGGGGKNSFQSYTISDGEPK